MCSFSVTLEHALTEEQLSEPDLGPFPLDKTWKKIFSDALRYVALPGQLFLLFEEKEIITFDKVDSTFMDVK